MFDQFPSLAKIEDLFQKQIQSSESIVNHIQLLIVAIEELRATISKKPN